MDGPGFHVDVDRLEEAGRAIKRSVTEQDNFELRGLAGEADMYGHTPLRDALMDFCVRWSDRIDDLVDDADDMAAALQSSAYAYQEADRAGKLSEDPAIGTADG